MSEKPIKVRQIRRVELYGWAFTDNGTPTVEYDPRQDSQTLMDTLIHECLHLEFPKATERKVEKSATRIAKVLWRMGYRRISK